MTSEQGLLLVTVVESARRYPVWEPTMQRPQRISTIERLYPDQWVTVEVTRYSPSRGALSGRVLAHAPDEQTITRAAVKAREEHPDALLYTFYTGPLIPEGVTVIFGCG